MVHKNLIYYKQCRKGDVKEKGRTRKKETKKYKGEKEKKGEKMRNVSGQPIRFILTVKQSKENAGDIRDAVTCRMVCVGGDWFAENMMLANRVSGTLRRG